MLFKIVLIGSIVAQLVAAFLSLRINTRYRRYSAWLLISASSVLLALVQLYGLWIIWEIDRLLELITLVNLWSACLMVLMVSVLFLGGVALIEPSMHLGQCRETDC